MATNFRKVTNARVTTTAPDALNNTTNPVQATVVDASTWPLTNFNVTFWNRDLYPDPDDDPNQEIVLFSSRVGNTCSGGVRGDLGTTSQAHSGVLYARPLLEYKHLDEIQQAVNTLETTYAPLASPALTGAPTAPTPPAGDNSTRIATTAFVQNALQIFAGQTVPVQASVSGTIDGINTAFTISPTPINGSEIIIYRGQIQKPGVNYTISGNQVTFTFAPSAGSNLDAVVYATNRPAQPTRATPSGTVDSSNSVFTLSPAAAANSEILLYNGQVQTPGVNYNMSGGGGTITFTFSPLAGSQLDAYYFTSTSGAFTRETPSGAINGTNKTFTMSSAPYTTILIYNGGALKNGVDYTVSGNTITMTNAPLAGSQLSVLWW